MIGRGTAIAVPNSIGTFYFTGSLNCHNLRPWQEQRVLARVDLYTTSSTKEMVAATFFMKRKVLRLLSG